ncbi:MAG: DUF4159 domain-containing protein [Myxococcota bacterium]
MDRRRFLQGIFLTAAATAWPSAARGIGVPQNLRVVRLRHDGNWDVHQGAGEVLAEEVKFRTSVDVSVEEVALSIDDPRLGTEPFAILAGDDDFTLGEGERETLRRWLELGGFLVIDNAGRPEPSKAFDRAVRREMEHFFPRTPLQRISPGHVLYRSFYRLDYPAGREIRRPYLEGLRLGRRYGVVLSHNDLLGAWARDPNGRFRHTPTPGGANQREMSFRLGINLVMYAMCLHYKDDQVHLDYLLHNRKWKIERPE